MRPRSNMKLNPEDLAKITDFTLSHYNEHAEDFWEGTRDHNVNQNITALLQSTEGEPPYTILDFGCGPGRDLKVFAELGHIAIGLDGAPHFAVMARAHSGCEVWQQDFLKLDLPDRHFDGVCTVSRTLPGVTACVARAVRNSKTEWCPLQLEPARPQRGRLEWWALRRVS